MTANEIELLIVPTSIAFCTGLSAFAVGALCSEIDSTWKKKDYKGVVAHTFAALLMGCMAVAGCGIVYDSVHQHVIEKQTRTEEARYSSRHW